jgi:hypothetical protein
METAVLVIPFIVMLAPVLIALIFMRYRARQTQARYAMLLQLADKGVPLTPDLLAEPRLADGDRRRALVLIAAGLGVMATLLVLPGHVDDGQSIGSLWGLGLLPLMIGLGYLASWWLNRREPTRG